VADIVGWGSGGWGASAWGQNGFVRNAAEGAAGSEVLATIVDGLAYATEGAQATDSPAGQFLWAPVNNPQTPNWQQVIT